MLRNIVLFDGESTTDNGLWMTNGTTAGTQELIGTNLGATGFVSFPLDVTAFGGEALFKADGFLPTSEDENGFGNSLWVTDLTAGGTHELTGIAGAYTTGSGLNPSDMTVFNGKVLFQGMNTQASPGLWVTDGTVAGTYELTGISGADTTDGILSGGTVGGHLTVYNNEVLFDGRNASFDSGLWVTDGTATGTHELTGISGAWVISGGNFGGLEPEDFTPFNGKVLFVGNGTDTSPGLWVTDGTSAGTQEVRPFIFTVSDLTVFNGEVLFNSAASVNDPDDLWVTDGTLAGTHELTGIAGVSPNGLNPTDLTVYNGKVLFEGADAAGFNGLWVTDGTAAGTYKIVATVAPGIGIFGGNGLNGLEPDFSVIDGKAVFAGFDSIGKHALWATDGTSAGTQEVSVNGANTANGVFPENFSSVLAARPDDVTGDGTSDVLLQSGGSIIDWTISNGTYAGYKSIGGASGYGIVGTGDFNGDGSTDILLQNGGGSIIDWTLSNGAYSGYNSVGNANASGYGVVGTGDFNADGTSDILLENGSGALIDWIIQNGTYSSYNSIGGTSGYGVIGTGDFNGDGTTDVLLQNAGGSIIDWTLSNGGYSGYNGVANANAAGYGVVGTGDFNGDGTADLLLENGSGNLIDWIMQGGHYAGYNQIGNTAGYSVAGTGAYTGNGTTDILLKNGSGNVIDWIMTNGTFSGWNEVGGASGYGVVKS